MNTCDCRPAPADRCPSSIGQGSCSCSRPAGHTGAHVKCVHAVGGTIHDAYEWTDQ